MKALARGLPLAVLCCLAAACGPASLERRVSPYPAHGQTPERMQRDSAECERWARASAGSAAGSAARGAAATGAIGSVLGAGAGAVAGAFFGAVGRGAAIGASVAGAEGALRGAVGAVGAWDQRCLRGYRNCMAARGYAVGGRAALPGPPDRAADLD